MANKIDRNSPEYITLMSKRLALLRYGIRDIKAKNKDTDIRIMCAMIIQEDNKLIKQIEKLGE